MTQPTGPREIKPVLMWGPDSTPGVRDFRPNVTRSSDEEVLEVQEAITPAPKEESVQESADSKGSLQKDEPVRSEALAQDSVSGPMGPMGADKANGKGSESSEDESLTSSQTSPSDENSSPSSSSPKSPGASTPPAPASPPQTSGPTPTQ